MRRKEIEGRSILVRQSEAGGINIGDREQLLGWLAEPNYGQPDRRRGLHPIVVVRRIFVLRGVKVAG